jgi:hypothetical protein
MGSGVSAFPPSIKVEIMQKLKARYEFLQLEGKSEDEIRDALSEELAAIIHAKEQNLLVSISEKDVANSKQIPRTNAKVTRRRSFGGDIPKPKSRSNSLKKNHVKNDGKIIEPDPMIDQALVVDNTNIVESNEDTKITVQDVTIPPNSEYLKNLKLKFVTINVVDSWESVKEQPSCLLCKTVFTSVAKLQTHIKFSVSSIHSHCAFFSSLILRIPI